MSLLSEMVTPEAWLRAICFKTAGTKAKGLQPETLAGDPGGLAEAPRALRPEALGLRPTEST